MASTATTTILNPTVTGAPAAANSPPIVDILRFIHSATTVAVSAVARASGSLARAVAGPLSTLFTVLYQSLLYVLGPLLVFCDIVVDALVRTPYSIAAAILSNLYPLYVFVGATCICAACVGLTARICVNLLKRALLSSKPSKPGPAPRLHKRVSIKDERQA